MRIVKLIDANIPTVDINDPYEKILSTVSQSPVKAVPVLENNHFVGILELVDLLVSPSRDIHQAVQRSFPVADSNLSIFDSPPLVKGPLLPVVNEKKTYLGCVTAQTLIRHLISELKQLNAIVENSYDGILVTDANGEILLVNQALVKLSNMPREAYIGRNIIEIIESGIFRKPSVALKALNEKQQITDFQQCNTGVDVMVTATPMFDENQKLICVLANVHDITELLKLKKQLEKTELLTSKYYTKWMELSQQDIKGDIVAASPQMKKIMEWVEHVGPFDSTVLLLGESGVGKEVVARALHENSKRKTSGAYIKVNCGAIPHNLLESEFFGYAPGAFTGAKKGGKPGLFELADNGTLFLDEIGELPLDMQSKLLRVLQDQQFTRVGGTEIVQVNVRIIAATNRDLKSMVNRGEFREDLYYRLNVIPITIPPLRERKEDIPGLVWYFLNKFNKKYNQEKYVSPAAMDKFLQYSWPGNVRELSNMIERLVVTVKQDVIHPEDISFEHADKNMNLKEEMKLIFKDHSNTIDSNYYLFDNEPTNLFTSNQDGSLHGEVQQKDSGNMIQLMEKALIQNVIKSEGSIRKAAKKLGVSHTTLIRKMKKHGIRKFKSEN